MIKPKEWKGQALEGRWAYTLKLDGVRMLRNEAGEPVSRNGKPLYGCQKVPTFITDAEIFCGNWEDSITAVKTKDAPPVHPGAVFSINPLDPRLLIGFVDNPTSEQINKVLEEVTAKGVEGLVLRKVGSNDAIKVKPFETYDVVVRGAIEGTGRNAGRMGALITDMGNVGVGFTDLDRDDFWINDMVGETIEVKCRCLTKAGKFKEPRFVRVRWDK